MQISYNWLKELVDFDYKPAELDHILTMLGIEVENILDYGKKYSQFFTGKVLKKEKHPNADKLSVCEVDYGNAVNTVVCGAPNVDAGQKVVLGLPGAFVPRDNFIIESKAVRNIKSDGMICSQSELEIGEDSAGIWVLPADTPIGLPLASFLNLNDIILDVSLTPNKADCLSHLGIARELAAYMNKKVNKPAIKNTVPNKSNSEFGVIIEDAEKCPRYSCRIIKNVSVKESPDWLKQRLILIGLRPVNVVVDVTNLVLMEQGQPLHAFDLNKISGNKIICKTAKNGEKFKTLDGKERLLDDSMLMICDAERNIAVGGVMGGENSEITNETKDVLLESAFFKPSSIRKTAKTLGIQSDASYRFERGVDIDNVVYSLNRASELIAELSGGKVADDFIDVYPNPKEKLKLNLRYQRAKDIIGIDITSEFIKDILVRLGFNILSSNEVSCEVEVPFRRVDVSLEIDLIEEIARLYNYDNIEPDFSISVSMTGENVPERLAIPPMRKLISDYLVKRGFNEIITQNMIDPATAKLFSETLVEISNPLGEELSIMRPSIIPAMLKTIERNIRLGTDNLRLFEIGKSFHIVDDNNDTFIKNYLEKEEIVIALSGKFTPLQWGIPDRKADFYDIKGILEELFEFLRLKSFKLNLSDGNNIVFGKNSLDIISGNIIIGHVGEVNTKLLNHFGMDFPVFLIYLDFALLNQSEKSIPYYTPVPPYPGIFRDLGFVVNREITSKEIHNEIMNKGGKLLKSVVVFDVYEGKSIEKGKKSIAFSLSFSSEEKTLKDEEVDSIVGKIIKAVESNFEAQLRKF